MKVIYAVLAYATTVLLEARAMVIPMSFTISGRNLRNEDTGKKSAGVSDPYVIVNVVETGKAPVKLGETEHLTDTLNPTWRKTFQYNLDTSKRVVFKFEVWDDDGILRTDDKMGEGQLDASSLSNGGQAEVRLNTEGSLIIHRTGGLVFPTTTRATTLLPNPLYTTTRQYHVPNPLYTTTRQYHVPNPSFTTTRRYVTGTTLRYPTSYGWAINPTTSRFGFTTTRMPLILTPQKLRFKLSAQNLENKDASLFGDDKSDPFVKVYVVEGGHTERKLGETQVINNDLNPRWPKVFEVMYKPNSQQVLRFKVRDSDSFGSDEKLGSADVNLLQYVQNGQRAFLPLSSQKGALIVEQA